MYTNNKLSKAVRLAIAFGAASTTAFTAAVNAAEEDAAKVERIEVTGSRLKRTDLETASPITVIGRDAIDAGGFRNIGEMLTTLNQADALGLTNVTNDTNGNDGTQTISLRGIGSSRTLVLVDGRRWLALGGGQVDISQIPVAAVERVEVLADGASAIYGSDAIGGVINIITRKDFEGAEFDFSHGKNFEDDGESNMYGFSLGVSNAKSNLFFNFNRVTQAAIGAGDREISEVPLAGTNLYRSAFGEFGIFNVPGIGLTALRPEREIPGLLPNQRTAADFGPLQPFNFAPQNYLQTPYERNTAFVKGSHQINDNLRAFAQFTYNQRKSQTFIAAVPLTMGFSGPQWVIPISANNVYNPFGVQINQSGFRMSPAGPRARFQDYDTYFATLGLEGDFELADRGFYWDAAYSRGEASRHARGENYVNLARLRNGLGASFIDAGGTARCGTPGAVVAGCVPVNLFNGVTGMTQQMVDYITYTQQNKTNTGVRNVTGNISTELFELPAGAVGIAAGLEYRTDIFNTDIDPITAAGIGSDNFSEPTDGSKSAEEYYVELAIPLLRDVTFAKSLELSVAGRSSKFTNEGLVGVNPLKETFTNDSAKVGFTYEPVDGIMVRGNYAQTFRAPSVADLFSGGGESFGNATDLCSNSAVVSNPWANQLTPEQQARCIATGVPAGGSPQQTSQIRQLLGGNPFLQPEKGDTKTLGFVYTSEMVEGFDMSADWWKISLEDVLSTVGANTIVRNCIVNADPASCAFIERIPTGEIQTIRRAAFNLASIEIEGIDASFNYKLNTENFGTFGFNLNTTYTISAKTTTGALSEAQSVVGEAEGAFGGPTWRLRSTAAVTWKQGDWDANWSMRHTSSLTESCVIGEINAGVCNNVARNADNTVNATDSFNRIGTVVYHDMSVGYALPWDASVRVGARNVFRKDPPLSLSAFANSFLQNYDIPGGTYFVSYRQSF